MEGCREQGIREFRRPVEIERGHLGAGQGPGAADRGIGLQHGKGAGDQSDGRLQYTGQWDTSSERSGGFVHELRSLSERNSRRAGRIALKFDTGASNAVHLLDEQASHAAYILNEVKRRSHHTVEPSAEVVDGYTEMISSSPNNKTQIKFYASCTPDYYNGEDKGSKPEDLFFGNRYGGKVLTFYHMLEDWRRDGTLPGMSMR